MIRITKPEAMALLQAERARMPLARHRDCVMCVLASPEWEPALIVAQNDVALLRLNRIPSRPNEMMVVLRDHVERVSDVPRDVYVRMFDLAHAAASVLESRREALRVFVAQLGAPEDVLVSYPHLHVHVLPLYEGGEAARPSRVFSWSEIVYTYDGGEAETIAAALRSDLLSAEWDRTSRG